MNIIIPSNYISVDLLTEKDPNKFGEALREYCFVGNCMETGCYSTFNVKDWFKQIKSGTIFEEAKSNLYEDIEPTIYHYKLEEEDCYMYSGIEGKQEKYKVCEPCEIVMGWTWDGDGCLYFRFNDRAVVNTDCKKDYTWEWIE